MTETSAPEPTPPTCGTCGAEIDPAHRFCESCGAVLAEVQSVAVPRTGGTPEGPCAECGNATHADGYCTQCGHLRAEPDRDEATIGPMVLMTDRGVVHTTNEDAGAAGFIAGDGGRRNTYVAVVCDGVSSAKNSASASAAATKAAVEAMLSAVTTGRAVDAAALAGLAAASEAASAAQTDPTSAPSCTYSGAIVIPKDDGTVQITTGNVGDSRAYWLPAAVSEAAQLTVDDSLARELMAAGASADSDIVKRGEHTLTRWLGADSDEQPWADDAVKTITATGPGTVLVCSDGLWNYLPDSEDLAARCAGRDPATAARELTEFAIASGGHDNITVILIPIGGPAT